MTILGDIAERFGEGIVGGIAKLLGRRKSDAPVPTVDESVRGIDEDYARDMAELERGRERK